MDDSEQPSPTAMPDFAAIADTALSLQSVLDIIPAGALIVDPMGQILAVNAELSRQFGYGATDLLGQNVDMLVPATLRDGHAVMRSVALEMEHMRAMGPGRSLSGERNDGTAFPIEVGIRAIRTPSRQFVLAIVTDRSHQVRSQALEDDHRAMGVELAHQEAVSREMVHRVKNLMATVSALISFSARGAQSVGDMEQSLRARIFALSSATDLAFRSEAGRNIVPIADILHAVLAPFVRTDEESSRVSLSGPDTLVGQRPAASLALIFHELTTNALKHGALRHMEGHIAIEWLQADDSLVFAWREYAFPSPDTRPATGGFGSKLISRLVENEFGGTLTRMITQQGITVGFRIPLASLAP